MLFYFQIKDVILEVTFCMGGCSGMVKIDGNEKASQIMPLFHQGKYRQSKALEEAVLKEIKESGQDHCSCKLKCERHGN